MHPWTIVMPCIVCSCLQRLVISFSILGGSPVGLGLICCLAFSILFCETSFFSDVSTKMLLGTSPVIFSHVFGSHIGLSFAVYEDSIVLDLCALEMHKFSDSCSGTYICRLLKTMVLNVVLKSTREKQAAKVCSRKAFV